MKSLGYMVLVQLKTFAVKDVQDSVALADLEPPREQLGPHLKATLRTIQARIDKMP